MRTWIVIGLLAAATSAPALAQEEEPEVPFEEAFAEEVEGLLEGLDGFAEWCGLAKLFIERDKAFEVILVFDPENFRAHKGLKHRQLRDGSWVEEEDKKPPRNYKPAKLRECARRRAAVVAGFRDGVFDLIERYGEKATEQDRGRAFDVILSLDPDDQRVHAALGHERDGEGWVLLETLEARQRRGEMKAAVTRIREAAPQPREVEPSEAELGMGVSWSGVVATPEVRVLATTGLDEAAKVARLACTALEYGRWLTGADTTVGEGYSIHVLGTKGERDALIDSLPDVSEIRRRFLKSLESCALPGRIDVMVHHQDARNRQDAAVRLTLYRFLNDAFQVSTDHGWICEGLGIYLTRQVVGTRLTWFIVLPEHTGDEINELRGLLMSQKVNWMNEAYKRLKGPKPPDLGPILAMEVNRMGVEDLLVSYALSAWLLEAQSQAVPQVLLRIGAGEASRAVLQDTLGFDPHQLREELVQWLGERR